MNAIQLHKPDGSPTSVWYCEKCGIINKDHEEAERCCNWRCEDCNTPIKNFFRQCESCRRKERSQKEQQRLENAELVEDYEGFIFSEEVEGYHDGYFGNDEELIEYCIENERAVPEFAYTCTEERLRGHVDDIIERIMDQGYEDIETRLTGIKELEAAIDVFNEQNKQQLTVYNVDKSRKVAVRNRMPAA